MAPSSPRLRVLSVGGNALSAFLSWRLQATHACDVTLVWKTTYDAVSQYGISFKSAKYGNERFKPHQVVRTPEEAGTMGGDFDYVLLSVKALPDVYDIASIIESVVTPQHTCILVNTTTALGTEAYLESRYPTNVVLSLVSGVALNQVGTSEFEHTGGSDIWVGSAIQNDNVPHAIQLDMAHALSLTLSSGAVDCHVSPNIRQQQWERMMGPIAFHPLSVIMDTPNLSALMDKTGCRETISDLIDELMSIAKAQGCSFPDDFKQRTIEDQLKAPPANNIMHQDFLARRPLEVETFLGSPMKIGKALDIKTHLVSLLYAILHDRNIQNQTKPPPTSPSASTPNGVNSRPATTPAKSGMLPPRRGPQSRESLEPPMGPRRRGPPPVAGGMHSNGYPQYPPKAGGDNSPRAPSAAVSRRNSFDNDLEEFGHIALYGDMVDGDAIPLQDGGAYPNTRPPITEQELRARELALREREQMLREQEMRGGRRGPPSRAGGRGIRGLMSRRNSVYGDDDDEDEEYYADSPPVPPMPAIDVDNFDMMSVTSKRNRRLPSAPNMRQPQEVPLQPRGRHSMFNRSGNGSRSRASTRMMSDVPGLNDSLIDNPLMAYSSNRYGNVDRKMMTDSSRANSMTSQRHMDDIRDNPAFGGGAYPPMPPMNGRRMSNSPGDMRPNLAANNYGPRPGYRGPPMDGQPIREPMPKYPPGQVLPHQVEQQLTDGVSPPLVFKGSPNNAVRSTTGSASASLNDSGSSGDQSAYSSTSSLEKRMPAAARVAVS